MLLTRPASYLRDPSLISRQSKKIGFLIIDLLWLPVTLWLAFILRLGVDRATAIADSSRPLPGIDWIDTLIIFSTSTALIFATQLYRLRLQSFDLNALPRFVGTAIGLTILLSFIAFFREMPIPRTVAVYFGLLFGAFSILSRLLILSTVRLAQTGVCRRDPVAIYGAGSAGIQLASSLGHSSEVKAIGSELCL